MGFMASFWRDMQAWDRTVKIGVGMAFVLLIVLIILTLIAPQPARPAFLIGIIGVIIVAQGLILWGNRHLVTPYALAQQQFLEGDYAAARDTLLASIAETEGKGKRPSVDTLTLLGNTYRNLALLRESEDILTTALQRQPQNPFPLYGFGRTLLAAGRFADAEIHFRRAMEAGGPAGLAFDVALAQVLQNSSDVAFPTLREVAQDTTQDVTRRWMAQRLLPLEKQMPVVFSTDEATFGEVFWQKEAERFASTPYGQWIGQVLKTHNIEGESGR
jgi:tetratricopeptide (TPR) repeat protein